MPTDLSARSKPDACPGALRVHRAADGGLVRVRIPGGTVSGAQLEELSAAAAALGEGSLQLTSRANLQIRGLPPGSEVLLAGRLAAAGLLPSATHERVRNVVASPLSGCDDRGHLDVHPLVATLDRGLCADPRLAELPGRFLFTLDDGRCDVAGLGGDVGLLATGPDSFSLLLAGLDTGMEVSVKIAVRTFLAAATAFLDERDRQGSGAWRLAELPGGVSAVLDRLISASRSGAGVRATEDPPCSPECSPEPTGLAHGMAGARVVVPAGGPGPIGRVEGTTDRGAWGALVVGAPLGRLTREQSAAIAALAREGAGWIRVTPWRSIVLPPARPGDEMPLRAPGASEIREGGGADSPIEPHKRRRNPSYSTSTADRLDALAQLGLVTDPSSPLLGVTACTGRPGCVSAMADVRGDALRAASAKPAGGAGALPTGALPATGLRGLPVHWVACEHRCGRPVGRAVEVLATVDGYEVSVGGTSCGLFGTAGEAGTAAGAARRA